LRRKLRVSGNARYKRIRLTLPCSNSLYQITNKRGDASNQTSVPATPPACKTNPLCSHPVCDTSKSIADRVAALVDSFTIQEKILNLIDASAGSARLGLPSHEWWNEATHGVGSAPGVQFPKAPREFNHATSFPSPILTGATFDNKLMRAIGDVVGIEGRAFANHAFSGFNFWAPNMNPFREPRWGRGQETPGEDVLLVSNYVRNYVTGMQGEDPNDKLIIANCKHYAAYDLETGRHGNNYDPTQQDLADYYLSAFKTCVRDTHVGSIMCSYNGVGGMPTCASPYLLQDVLRDHWGFNEDYNFVVSDCSAVTDIWQWHNFTKTEEGAASVALNAGTDLECGNSYLKLNQSLALNHTTMARMDEALKRLYSALFTVAYFDGSEKSSLAWSDVATPEATELAYRAAVEGMVLLKNDGLLPMRNASGYRTVAVIGPYANATSQMQGDYSGKATYLRSPLWAFQNGGNWTVKFALGTGISSGNATILAEALAAAKDADLIVYCGGIDGSVESETRDRSNLTWPSNQLDLINQLSKLSKPMVVAQFGGGQVDDTSLVANDGVNALFWAGYPSQDGGTAMLDLLVGKKAFSGRLPITQYPASYANEVSMFNINLRPNANASFPGRTYKWYTGKPVFPFGFGLQYTKFEFDWSTKLDKSYDIAKLVGGVQKRQNGTLINDVTPFQTVSVTAKNVGSITSDYVALLFLSSANAGPAPRPIKSLVSYDRAHDLKADAETVIELPLTLGSLARADENGHLTIYPGDYKLALDNDESLTKEFTLTGEPAVIEMLPVPKANYEFSVPVTMQPPSDRAYSPS
jgi:beta-D-xylosidase 4